MLAAVEYRTETYSTCYGDNHRELIQRIPRAIAYDPMCLINTKSE